MSSKNHYTKREQQLESVLATKQKQVAVLEQERSALVNKERALQAAICMYEGPLEAFRQQALTATLQAAAASAPTAQHSSGTASIAPDSTTRTTEVQSVRSAQGVGQQAVGSSGVQSVASSAACSGRVSCSCQTAGNTPPPQSVLGHPSPSTQQKCAGWDCATYVQDSGGCDSGGCSLRRQLYTTQLLHKAIADPARMAGYLNMPKHERLNYWSEACVQLALLVTKYKSGIDLPSCNIRQRLEQQLDALLLRVVASGLWEDPAAYVQCLGVNVNSRQAEPCPDGWWEQVGQVLQVTPDQYPSIKLVWDRVKASTQSLLLELQQLTQQLGQLRQEQAAANRAFQNSLQQLAAEQLPVNLRLMQQRNQLLPPPSHQPPLQPSHQPPLQPSLQPSLQQSHQPPHQPLLQPPLQLPHQPPHQPLLQQQYQGSASGLQQLQAVWQSGTGSDLLGALAAVLLDPNQAHAGPAAAAAAAVMAEMARAGGASDSEQQQQQMELMSGPELVQAAMLEAAAFAGQQRLCEQQLQQQRVRVEQEAQGLQQQATRGLCGYGHPSDNGTNNVQLSPFPGVQPGHLFEPQQPQQPQQQQQQQEGPLLPQQQQQQQQQSPQPQQHLAGPRALMPDCLTVSGGSAGSGADIASLLSPAPRDEDEEVLLQLQSPQELELESRIQVCLRKMAVLHFCQTLQLANTLNRGQLAAMVVASHPFVLDAAAICEAVDRLGWEG